MAFFALASLLCVAGALAFFCLLLPRMSQAAATLLERMEQAKDAGMLLLGNLPLGIGPDQWQHVYPTVQTADYESAVVHCSYLQLGLDAGVIAVAILAALLFITTTRAVLNGQRCVWPLLGLLAFHSVIDFDLRYAFFLVLIDILAAMSLPPALCHRPPPVAA